MLTPTDLVDFADQLGITTEAALRASVSRAYYGTYHAVNAFHKSLLSQGNVLRPNEGMHSKLYQQLSSPTIDANDPKHTLSRRLGAIGLQLHGMRVKADYRLDETVDSAMKQQAILEARRVLSLIAGTP